MKNFEFKSQICTTKEQSERLIALGLKKETADCALLPLTDKVTSVLVKPSIKDIKNTIPAWSLHRLIELLDQNISIDDFAIEQAYDTVIEYIAFDIRHNQFNHIYLEEKL